MEIAVHPRARSLTGQALQELFPEVSEPGKFRAPEPAHCRNSTPQPGVTAMREPDRAEGNAVERRQQATNVRPRDRSVRVKWLNARPHGCRTTVRSNGDRIRQRLDPEPGEDRALQRCQPGLKGGIVGVPGMQLDDHRATAQHEAVMRTVRCVESQTNHLPIDVVVRIELSDQTANPASNLARDRPAGHEALSRRTGRDRDTRRQPDISHVPRRGQLPTHCAMRRMTTTPSWRGHRTPGDNHAPYEQWALEDDGPIGGRPRPSTCGVATDRPRTSRRDGFDARDVRGQRLHVLASHSCGR